MKKTILSLFLIVLTFSIVDAQSIALESDSNFPFKFEIEHPIFSPKAHVYEGVVFVPIVESTKRIKEWALTIRNEYNRDTAVFMGKREIPKRIVWDAADKKGVPVPDGQYSYEFILDDGNEIFTINRDGIIIDTVPPYIEMEAVEDVYFLDSKRKQLVSDIEIRIKRITDEAGIDFGKSFLSIINFNGKEVKTFNFPYNSFAEVITWDGIDDTYNILLPEGEYQAILTVFDNAGNSAQSSIKFLMVAVSSPTADVVEEAVSVDEGGGEIEQPVPQPKPAPAPAPAPKKASVQTVKMPFNFPERIFFLSGSKQFSNSETELLKKIAAFLKSNKNYKLKVAGRSDVLSEENNIKNMAANRAAAVKKFFLDAGIAEQRMTVMWHPVPQKANERNRRVDIFVISD
ncbi:MAG: OmpA family protein [Elusimicrobiota bacterium]|jgi:OOP family OmpA-OmpF porin|nr:OmpA family protein [Elusimicrobiota bacterium]